MAIFEIFFCGRLRRKLSKTLSENTRLRKEIKSLEDVVAKAKEENEALHSLLSDRDVTLTRVQTEANEIKTQATKEKARLDGLFGGKIELGSTEDKLNYGAAKANIATTKKIISII
jgi:predicted  nucleic acid-binding Zn-ribbon protein